MKQIYFIKWLGNSIINQVQSFDRWMWGWMATCFFFSMWASAKDGTAIEEFARIALTFILLGFWFLYGLVYTGLKTAWRKFNEEQEKMLNHLKDQG